ncbi:MAG: response regulator transcription factor [Victivallales bacterium]|nr:response regulator transcription factor [Victivallales bacterium]MBR6059440.1 response regulator transcription factor [Victivallales bacterium]
MKVLVVEDNPKIMNFLQKGLEEEGFAMDCCMDGKQAYEMASANNYDVIILDIMLPSMDGLAITSGLRDQGKKTPILLLTALDQIEDKVKGFEAGADDYLPKPFAFAELVARIRALSRRNQNAKEITHYTYNDLEMDIDTHQAKRGDQVLDLTVREFALLLLFIQSPERLVTRSTILERVWDMNFDPGTNILDVHMSHLRKKLDEGHKVKLLQTVRGIGYMLKAVNEND